MKIKRLIPLLAIVLCSCGSDDTEIAEMESTAISSASFETALIHIGIDSDGILNGKIETKDISKINYLPLNGQNITSLSGLEKFSGLKKLECANNDLTSIDVSQNITLKELDFSDNKVTNIDVSQNIALTSLVCFNNELTSLDVSQNTALATLACTNNQLMSLDLSLNTELTQIYCSENNLTNLDVSLNIELIELFCFENELMALDVSQNGALKEFYCNDNKLVSLNVKNGQNQILTEFNFSGNDELNCVEVDDKIAADARNVPYNVWVTNTSVSFSENCSFFK